MRRRPKQVTQVWHGHDLVNRPVRQIRISAHRRRILKFADLDGTLVFRMRMRLQSLQVRVIPRFYQHKYAAGPQECHSYPSSVHTVQGSAIIVKRNKLFFAASLAPGRDPTAGAQVLDSNNTATGADFTVIKFDGMSGTELWRKTINGTANDFDTTFAVTVDAAGDVVAAGVIKNIGTGDDFIVVKLSGADGSNF